MPDRIEGTAGEGEDQSSATCPLASPAPFVLSNFRIGHDTCDDSINAITAIFTGNTAIFTGNLAYSIEVPHDATPGPHVLEQIVPPTKNILTLAQVR